jgi:hypothetical protein
MLCELTQAEYEKRIAETTAWCLQRADPDHPATCLRSLPLAPNLTLFHPKALPVYAPVAEQDMLYRCVVSERCAAMARLCEVRRDAVGANRAELSLAQEGRLVVCDFDMSMSDNIAELATNGFFDEDNRPPWDCWICYIAECDVLCRKDDSAARSSYLVAWVPPSLVELAARGVEGNPEGSISWADDVPPEQVPSLARLLRQGERGGSS